MVYRALTTVLLGIRPPVEPGELIPDTYADMNGHPTPVDFDRLVQAGAAEQVDEPAKPAKPAPTRQRKHPAKAKP